MTDQTPAQASDQIIDARRREMAIEHLLFGTIRFVAQRHPDLLDELDGSLDHLWDKAHGEERDDEAVREVARRFSRACVPSDKPRGDRMTRAQAYRQIFGRLGEAPA